MAGQRMSVGMYTYLVWLRTARPVVYNAVAKALSGTGEVPVNSLLTDAELEPVIRGMVTLYPPDNFSDRDLILSNLDRVLNGQKIIVGYYPVYIYVSNGGENRVVKLGYGTASGKPDLVDISPMVPEINAYADGIKAARLSASYVDDLNRAQTINQTNEINALALQAVQREADANAALIAAQKQAEMAASQKAASDASAAQEKARQLALDAKEAADKAAFANAELQRQIDYTKAVQAQAAASQASVDKAVADNAAAVAAVRATDAANATLLAQQAALVASEAHSTAVATTQNTNQTLATNNVTPADVSKTNHTMLYLILAGAAAYFAF